MRCCVDSSRKVVGVEDGGDVHADDVDHQSDKGVFGFVDGNVVSQQPALNGMPSGYAQLVMDLFGQPGFQRTTDICPSAEIDEPKVS